MEILELLEELEVMVLNSKKSFLISSQKAVVDKQEVIDVLDTIRSIVEDKYQLLKSKMTQRDDEQFKTVGLSHMEEASKLPPDEGGSTPNVKDAYDEANEIRAEIDDYADKVLENLKVTVTKFRRKLGNMDDIIDLSRDRIKNTAHYSPMVDEEEEDYVPEEES